MLLDENEFPVKVPNEEYIWGKLDQKIVALNAENEFAAAEKLKALKTAKVDEQIYDVTKVLAMHPLIGRETRPFEFHPLAEYGCTSCHSGNGQGLTTQKAHGPVFDGQYEVEFIGPTPKFIESDPKNDPQFARVFNGKPGPELLFQTTPILVGSLIEAKCVQCHQTTIKVLQGAFNAAELVSKRKINQPEAIQKGYDYDLQELLHELQLKVEHPNTLSLATDIDFLTKNLQHGENLFITQACYACHRISGFSRGGVGPELTQIGQGYPWHIKRKIMWPQGDLPTSTMPNEKLDYEELENLMTFLLTQQGESKAVSEQAYKVGIQQWEAGKKLPWEKPVSPSKIHDLRYSMTVFATEGCAACHRLRGFESDVGYRVEKQGASFDSLYKEKQWFSKLFPENILGSQIVDAIDKHTNEIDEHIADHVRQGSILEEIEKISPGTIEAYYHDFKFASRAKNYEFTQKANQEPNPEKKEQILVELQQWKDRVYHILMVYVQEYGLGHLIGPKLNWSGMYRSDEWLMEHFRNPGSHSPNSIMPVFPFDDTKFYALTYMLDILSKRNRDAERTIWTHRGFNPEIAFEIYCAQCHGAFRGGNGPVAEWIYPIPKNLRNAEFLRNLTEERAFFSIMHGIKGTPMPPWGEASQKPTSDDIPILNADEIRSLVDWLYSSLPGSTFIKESEDVLKWQYSPQNVLDELSQEGSVFSGSEESTTQNEIFAVVPNMYPNNPDKDVYFIKRKYYTTENIEQGKIFFETNCAVCHGTEADGSGVRASVMQDAKPRMLTNLDWLATRDDLRLIRSIKYGVPGTAMTPWGDLTTSLQRLQLVTFIRSVSELAKKREELLTHLYQAFDSSRLIVENGRSLEFPALDKLKIELDHLRNEEVLLTGKIDFDHNVSQKAVAIYQSRLMVESKLKQREELDKLLISIVHEIEQGKTLYKNIGEDLLSKMSNEGILDTLFEMLKLYDKSYTLQNGVLAFHFDDTKRKEIEVLKNQLVQDIDKRIADLEKSQIFIKGKIVSTSTREELNMLENEITVFEKLKKKIITNSEEAIRSINQQKALLEEFYKKR